MTPRSMEILRMLLGSGKRSTVFSCWTSQTDLARKLELTRQALSIHFKRLRESGFIQVGHGFVNVTEDGLRAIDHGANPVIVTVRFSPQKRMEAFATISTLPIIETHRVSGDADAVLIVNQNRLDYVLSRLAEVDGLVDAKSFVSIGKIEALPKSPKEENIRNR